MSPQVEIRQLLLGSAMLKDLSAMLQSNKWEETTKTQ